MPGYSPLVDALLETGMTAVVSAVIAALVGVLVTSIGRATRRSREREEQTDRMRRLTQDGVGMLIKDRLIHYHKEYVHRGWIDIDERQTFESLWEIYHTMGLNTVTANIRQDLVNLPTYPPSEGEDN